MSYSSMPTPYGSWSGARLVGSELRTVRRTSASGCRKKSGKEDQAEDDERECRHYCGTRSNRLAQCPAAKVTTQVGRHRVGQMRRVGPIGLGAKWRDSRRCGVSPRGWVA